jgi:hypothetical protein
VFKLTPAGTLTTLHVFEYAGGAEPFGGLVQATDGTFYGAAYSGGNFVWDRAVDFPGCGTVYSLSRPRPVYRRGRKYCEAAANLCDRAG